MPKRTLQEEFQKIEARKKARIDLKEEKAQKRAEKAEKQRNESDAKSGTHKRRATCFLLADDDRSKKRLDFFRSLVPSVYKEIHWNDDEVMLVCRYAKSLSAVQAHMGKTVTKATSPTCVLTEYPNSVCLLPNGSKKVLNEISKYIDDLLNQ